MQSATNESADILSGTYGRLTITYRRLQYTWTVTVYQGTYRVEELCATYDNAHAAWTEARRIALAAHEGNTVEQIHAAKPSELALAEVRQIIDGAGETLDSFRQPHRATPTRTGVHCKPLTAAELDLIRSHVGGVVTCKPGQSWTVLRAIHRRIGGKRIYKPGTRIIAALWLSDEQIGRAA